MTSVTVIVPAYNEGAAFGSSLVRIADYYAIHERCGYEFNYLIVDDGSTDTTQAVAQSFARWRKNVTVLKHDVNRGLGAALRTAFEHVTTEYAIVLDADLSYTPTAGMELLEALERENADVAIASPYMRGGSVANVPAIRRVLSREANRFLAFAAGRFSTFTCMVRAFRVSALRRLTFTSNRMAAIPELLLGAMKGHVRIVEVPASLKWSEDRRAACGRLKALEATKQTAKIVTLAFRHRPSLWLAVPGLFPGLLPLVVAVTLILHASAAEVAVASAATVAVQYSSLALFAGHLGAFFVRTRTHHPQRFTERRVHRNDYQFSERTSTTATTV
ncbi:MAG TPA: glycosyltransferase family 2 protein [Candidatus Baltobacteraceae bacterium]|nr:glycosyltransferase family 2 protein [Candidatus Baltobacteraceae bacterium]